MSEFNDYIKEIENANNIEDKLDALKDCEAYISILKNELAHKISDCYVGIAFSSGSSDYCILIGNKTLAEAEAYMNVFKDTYEDVYQTYVQKIDPEVKKIFRQIKHTQDALQNLKAVCSWGLQHYSYPDYVQVRNEICELDKLVYKLVCETEIKGIDEHDIFLFSTEIESK